MNTERFEKLGKQLKPGHVYRRDEIGSYSKSVDRDLAVLTKKGVLEKVGAGLYYRPAQSRFGVLPPADESLVETFLRDEQFLLISWNQYNLLQLGLTQLYNKIVVYNRKRHGIFHLAGKIFDFRRLAKGFPAKLSKEYLVVDLLNNSNELEENSEAILKNLESKLSFFDKNKILKYMKLYGKVSTQRLLKRIFK